MKGRMKRLLLLSLGAGMVSLALVEMLLRIFPGLYANLALPGRTVPNPSHPVYGWKSPPGAAYRFQQEGSSSGRMNRAGWRDVEHESTGDPDDYRILILGDSFVEALQVDRSLTFPRLLEARLNEICSPPPFEVIAMGKNGYGTAQEMLVYSEEGRNYDPDLVVVMFAAVNDFVDNSVRLATHDGRRRLEDNELRKPYFSLRDGTLTLDNSFLHTESYRSRVSARSDRTRFLLFDAARATLFKLRTGRLDFGLILDQAGNEKDTPTAIRPEPAGDNEKENRAGMGHLFRVPLTSLWEDEIKLTWALILELRRRVEVDGHGFLLVTIPSNFEVHSEDLWQPFAAAAHEGRAYADAGLDIHQPDNLIREFATAHGIRYINLLESLRQAHAETGRSPFGFGPSQGHGHFNAPGHFAVAETLLEEISHIGGVQCSP